MKTLEKTFIEQIEPLLPGARLERKKDKTGNTYHVTVRDVSKTMVLEVLKQQGFTALPSSRNHSTQYTGDFINFNGESVYVVVREARSRKGGHFVVQKQTAPEKLFLQTSYTSASQLKADVVAGLQQAGIDLYVADALISLLDVADQTSNNFRNIDVLDTDKSFITSDFGEVLGAYLHLVKGAKQVVFPTSSNNLNIDYTVDGIGYAHKSVKGSSRFTLDATVANSLLKLTYNCPHLKVLQSIVGRDKFSILNNAVPNCKELAHWYNLLGQFSEESLQEYVNTHSFEQYIEEVYNSQHGKLGIASKTDQVKQIWNQGSIEPMLFTFLTFMARYYSERFTTELGKIVRSVIGDNIFEYVDYNTINNEITVVQKPYQSYTQWRIHYHGNSLKAFNNWPAPVGIND
jgi:hypothetical protein